MPLQITLVPEEHTGTCQRCGANASLQRFYIEVEDYRGETPWLCIECQQTPTRTELQDPPQERGPHPPTRSLRKRISREELETARMVGGQRQKGSGSTPSAKGDIRVKGKLRGEEKSTAKGSYTIKRAVLDKIRSECVGAERPFVLLRFRHPVTMATEDRWVLIPVEDWEHYAATEHQRPTSA
jgi:hypothetical protein